MDRQPLAGRVAGMVEGTGQATQDASTDPRETLTRAQLDVTPQDLLLLSVVARDTAATAQVGGDNGTKRTWLTVDGISVTFDNGVLIATRGLGDDLMGADAPAVSALSAGAGQHMRTHDYLDGSDRIVRRVFECEVRSEGAQTIEIVERRSRTLKVTEACASRNLAFENTFWITSAGTIMQARQWVSPLVGYIDYQRL
jgi:hypothetical protein